jgi:two-component system phosphate regulon sensor histidine kinase PhoR
VLFRSIRQLIQNLTDNAIKYGFDNSEITIKASRVDSIPESTAIKVGTGKAVAISVNNHGEKISPEYINRLTERFYRMQTHKNQNIKGSGLGLAIAKHIIIRHRGNLKISSDSKSGTTFTIYLPIEQNGK